MSKEKKASHLALLLFSNESKTINNVTYYYLPVEFHNLYSSSRGFGMKKTIKHSKTKETCKLKELYNLILKDMEWEASFKEVK